MKTLKFHIEGIAPLIMQSARLADPIDPTAKAIKAITSKMKKSDEDHRQIGALEFEGALYHDAELGPIIPAANVERMLADAGALSKLKKKVKMAMQVREDLIPLQYDGPRDLPGLIADPRFHYRTTVVIKQARTVRERPWFHHWALDFTLDFDDTVFNVEEIKRLVSTAGRYIGLGTYRPRFGRFDASLA